MEAAEIHTCFFCLCQTALSLPPPPVLLLFVLFSSSDSSVRLAKELQEKNRVIQSLQRQLREQAASSHHSSHSDLSPSDRPPSSSSSSSSYSIPSTQSGGRGLGRWQRSAAWLSNSGPQGYFIWSVSQSRVAARAAC